MSLSEKANKRRERRQQVDTIDVGHAVPQHDFDEDSDRWAEARRRGIGGSDAATCLGLQPYGQTRTDLWRVKTGREETKVGNAAVRYGSIIEPHIRTWLKARARDTQVIYGAFGDLMGYPIQLHHPDHAWLRAHIDGLLVDGESASCGVEIKQSAHEYRSDKYDWPEGVHEYHYPQIQHYMAVTGLQEWWYVYFEVPADREFTRLTAQEHAADADDYWQWVIDQGTMTTHLVERDGNYIDRLIASEQRFWGHIDRDEPPVDWMPEGEKRVDDSELEGWLDEYGRLKALDKAGRAGEADAQRLEKLKGQIKQRAQSIAAGFDETPKKLWVNDEDYVLWHGSGYWVAKPEDRKPHSRSEASGSTGNDDSPPDPEDIELGF